MLCQAILQAFFVNPLMCYPLPTPRRYGVPGSSAADLEKCLAKNLGATSEPFSDHLYSITKMLSPSYLMQDGVSDLILFYSVNCLRHLH